MANETIDTEIDLSQSEDQLRRNLNESRTKTKQIAGDGGDDDAPEIDLVDDTPERDRGRPQRAPGAKSAVPTDEEVEKYSGTVKDRLKQMKWEYHEERRAKEQWQREHEAALSMAERIHKENQQLRKLVEGGHKSLLDSNKSAVENELTALKQSLKAAHEAGDAEKIAEISGQMSKAAARLVNAEQTKPLKFDDDSDKGEQQPQQRPQAPRLTQPMQDWMDENPWFNGKTAMERKMTSYAFGVHDALKAEGIPLESPAYFKRINDEMRQVFGSYYGESEDDKKSDSGGTRSQPQRRTVAGASRLAGSDNGSQRRDKKVTITQSEAAVAKRLGISVEQYAREKYRLENSNNG